MSRDSIVKLESSDRNIFEVDLPVARELKMVRSIIDGMGTDNLIPLPEVTGKILAKVIEYATYHVEAQKCSDEKPSKPNDEIKKWDAEFITVDQYTLYDLIMAANYLNYAKLLDLGCEAVTGMIEGKTPREIKDTFNIKHDFTREEEEQIMRENPWAFE